MNYKKIQGVVVNVCLLLTLEESLHAKTEQATTIQPVEIVSKSPAKKLELSKMMLLNKVLEFKPWIAVEMYITGYRAMLISDSIDEDRGHKEKVTNIRELPLYQQEAEAIKIFLRKKSDADRIKTSLNYVVSPAKEFFKTVRENSKMLKPLLEGSLQTSNSLLGRFFDAKNDDNFFEKEIKTLDNLQLICLEYITFFKAVEASLTSAAKEKYLVERVKHFETQEKLLQEKRTKKVQEGNKSSK